MCPARAPVYHMYLVHTSISMVRSTYVAGTAVVLIALLHGDDADSAEAHSASLIYLPFLPRRYLRFPASFLMGTMISLLLLPS